MFDNSNEFNGPPYRSAQNFPGKPAYNPVVRRAIERGDTAQHIEA